jgi:hypothetical protein
VGRVVVETVHLKVYGVRSRLHGVVSHYFEDRDRSLVGCVFAIWPSATFTVALASTSSGRIGEKVSESKEEHRMDAAKLRPDLSTRLAQADADDVLDVVLELDPQAEPDAPAPQSRREQIALRK